jgi:hypothetical protein
MGIEVVPMLSDPVKLATLGTKYPSPTPKPMARNIQRVKKRSSIDSRRITLLGSALLMFSSLVFAYHLQMGHGYRI